MTDDNCLADDCNLIDLTNLAFREGLRTGLPTPPSERKRVRHFDLDGRESKRLKFDSSRNENGTKDEDEDSGSEDDDWDASCMRRRDFRYSVYGLRNQGMLAGPSRLSRQPDRESNMLSYRRFIDRRFQCSLNKISSTKLCFITQSGCIQVSVGRREDIHHPTIRMLIYSWYVVNQVWHSLA